MKKKIFLGVTISIFVICAMVNASTPVTNNAVSEINAVKSHRSKIDLNEDLTSGSLRSSDGETVIDLYQGEGYLQLVVKVRAQYSVKIENGNSEVVYNQSISSSQGLLNIPTVFYPEDFYKVTIYNVDKTAALVGEVYIAD